MHDLLPILIFLGAFALAFGIRYLSNREKMAMIERGIDPGIARSRPSAPMPFLSLKFGLLLVGLGIGLLLALFISMQARIEDEQATAVYFGCLSIFGGIGLILSYIIERKWLDNHPEK
jgi:uncharacterized membrane protein HdeD (DUF308 family)